MERHEHLPRTGPFMGAKEVGVALAEAARAAGSDAPIKALRAAPDLAAFRALVEAHASRSRDVTALLGDLNEGSWIRYRSVILMFAKAELGQGV